MFFRLLRVANRRSGLLSVRCTLPPPSLASQRSLRPINTLSDVQASDIERGSRAKPFEDDFVGAPTKVHFAGGDLAQARHGRLVFGFDERVVALHELSGPDCGQDDEGKAIFFSLEAIFDGDACHRLRAG